MASVCKLNGKWRALIRRKGHDSISKRFSTRAAAEAWAREIEGQIDQGRAVQVRTKSTIADLITTYRGLRERSRPIADSSNEHYVLKTLEADLGDIRASALSVEDLVGFATKRRDDGAGPYTVNMDISKLGTVMRYAGDGLPDVVGAARPKLSYLGLIGGGGKRDRRPTQDELDAVIAALPEPMADVVRFAVLTSMRRGEIIGLKWADLNAKKKTVIIRDRKHPRKKIGNDEEVPLLGAAWDLAKAQPTDDEDGRIFPLHPQTLSKAFKTMCDKLGIPDLHFHDLRHEGVSRMFEQGFAIQQVALVSGHKDWRHLARYTNLTPESLHEVVPK